jgi:hypothetical protein
MPAGLSGEVVTGAALVAAALAAAAAWALLRLRLGRRRRALVAWLAGGAEVFAGAAASRWLGARGLTVRVEQPAPPFRTLTLAVRLDPAGLSLLPLPTSLGRRLAWRDRLEVQSELSRPPRAEFDFFYPDTAGGRQARAAARDARWRVSEVGADSPLGLGPLSVGEPAGPALAPRDGLLAIARRIEELSPEVRRVAIRRRAPHLVAEVAAPGATGQVSGQAFFDLLREAAFLGLGPSITCRPADDDPTPR